MIELSKRVSLIAKIAEQKPLLGKTAMMKFIFILQQVYKVPTGYDYEIYTYGPYSSEVMEDIQLTAEYKAIRVNIVTFPNGYFGYQLNPTETVKNIIDKEKEFVDSCSEPISEVIRIFGDKNAKELELSSTIIYLYSNYCHNNWDSSVEEISQGVKKIKPHFDVDLIRDEYRELDELGILKMSV